MLLTFSPGPGAKVTVLFSLDTGRTRLSLSSHRDTGLWLAVT